MLRFRLHFLPDMPERTSNFHKVVQQHTEGMVGNVVWVLLEIFLAFQE